MAENERALFTGVETLLAQAAGADLPPPAERTRLRKAAGLTQAQIAKELGLKRRETVAEWESGEREPRPPRRTAYLQLLQALAARFPAPSTPSAPAPAGTAPPGTTAEADDATQPAAAPPPQPASRKSTKPATSTNPARSATSAESAKARKAPRSSRPPRRLPAQQQPEAAQFIAERVHTALTQHEGDTEAATAALLHKAIPDAMELLEMCRHGGRYDFSRHPHLPDLLHKQPGRDADDIWEARPKWALHPAVLTPGTYEVTALDVNAAYLSALKTHLPIGALEHHLGPDDGGPAWDRRRSGIHRITPPHWPHPHLPNPLGNREEPGPLWVTEATLRLFHRAAAKGWCAPPAIHESWTSGASEGLLDKLREGLTLARRNALADGDDVTVEYIKAMYAKLVSTMGESNYNRDIYRPDWVHQIRAQAFANLWHKAEKAQQAGLHVVRMTGTDELHLIGDWRHVFTEGRDVTQVKIKDTYTLDITPKEGK